MQSMREIVLWMIKIDKVATIFAQWIGKKNLKYTENLEQAKIGNADPKLFERIATMHINDFALSNRTRKDMLLLMSRLPKHMVLKMFTKTQQDACILFSWCMQRLPNILQKLDLADFPHKKDLSMLTCREAQAAIKKSLERLLAR
jgi:hypothetical protein